MRLKHWTTCDNRGLETLLIPVSTDLQRMRETSNLGLCSTFLLNHFTAAYVFKNDVMKCADQPEI